MAKAPLEIKSLARAHTKQAIKVLVGVMNEEAAPHAARVAAANSLLDRGWGKAEQHLTGEIEHNHVARVPEVQPDIATWQHKHNGAVTVQ